MAFILVFILLKQEAYSSLPCQIVLLHVQSKLRNGIAAMHRLHDEWHNFVIFIRRFRQAPGAASLFLPAWSYFASAK
jgi:hypothetical protein